MILVGFFIVFQFLIKIKKKFRIYYSKKIKSEKVAAGTSFFNHLKMIVEF